MSTLYVVATPIGNLEDITIRAIKILLGVPVIVCEDTRRTGSLLKILEERYRAYLPVDSEADPIARKFVSVRDWNEAGQVGRVLDLLRVQDAALVSDAGTPLLSDPGYKLVRGAIESGITIVPIPGPFAAAAALSASGLPTDKFIFWGFAKKNKLPELASGFTHVFYESPERVGETIKTLKGHYADAEAVVALEMTKIHEQFLRGGEILQLTEGKVLGEVVILVRV